MAWMVSTFCASCDRATRMSVLWERVSEKRRESRASDVCKKESLFSRVFRDRQEPNGGFSDRQEQNGGGGE